MLRSKAAILEEQLQAAEVRCRRLEATAVLYAQLQAAQQPQKRELEQWRSLLGDLPEAERGPQAVMRILDELRGQTLSLADQTGQHKAEALRMQGKPAHHTSHRMAVPCQLFTMQTSHKFPMGRLRADMMQEKMALHVHGGTQRRALTTWNVHAGELQAAQAAARAAAAAQSQLEAAEAEASGVIARLERKVALLTKERDVLKEIVASYDAEEANFSGMAGLRDRSLSYEYVWSYPLTAQMIVLDLHLRSMRGGAWVSPGYVWQSRPDVAWLDTQRRSPP